MLGERIRKLRKQKKLTLEALAGTGLTKGMLSLIENNKANPSMESLTHIAGQLGVELAELLGEVSSEELRSVLEKAEKIHNTPLAVLPDKSMQLIELIAPFIDKLTQGFESARLMEIYSYALQREKKPDWQKYLKRAADIFDMMNISSNRTAIGIFLSNISFHEHNYRKALEIFLIERKKIETNHAYIEPMARLDLDYHEAILLFAVGEYEAAVEAMEKALAFSKEKRIFYLIDDLYRLAAAHAWMDRNKRKMDYYLKKLKQYGEFADDSISIYFYRLFQIIELISEKKEYSKALDKAESFLSDPERMKDYDTWFNLEKAKSLYYLGRYDEALQTIEKVGSINNHHPIDLTNHYIKDTFKALILAELGRHEEAITAAETAVENLAPMPDSQLKRFSLEALVKIRGDRVL
ncbi:helix-turn-helix domain-containing protein [Bacillus tianshenii]|uniref:helix-turn-helix domain-containing protein n=1 Tax=Sutcliffiella tianshenii TaxID=1463404 RepID=UPI001CD56F0F|nr:helix-turn-helix domain-containing protein [Bacillus tianshenii]MCA1318510.1 helix-turn-helix domain-containing protein [Bacillus tianshenii]